mgnify:CR=1 FL=1
MIFNIFLFIIFGALLLIIGVPLLLYRLLKGSRPFSGVRSRRGRREGEVTVSGKDATAGEKIVGDHIGEYVDYEEVEEKK